MRALGILLIAGLALGSAHAQQPCVAIGEWTVPGAGRVSAADALARATRASVVLLGESHANADHHRWQLQTLAALFALYPRLVLGFEAFPRRVQPVLDRWSAGELNEQEFLDAAEWRRVWGYDASLYLPLFHFARLNRIPMIALNVEREFTDTVGKLGLEGVAVEKREGVRDAAPPSEAYLARLFESYTEHGDKKRTPARSDPAFRRFVEAQLVWDRAMAQAIAERLARDPAALVVGIMGSGHVVHGHGVAHQLQSLGVTRVASLIPWDHNANCRDLVAGLATAVFALPAARPGPEPPRLGVVVETAERGVRISSIASGSVAEAAGLRAGDVLIEIAGTSVKSAAEVRAIVQSVAPGTWLPLKALRQREPLELLAKFPARSR